MTVGKRVRSDKKKQVAATVSIHLADAISRISYITRTPIKDVAEAVCISGITTRKVIAHLSVHFRRDIRFKNTVYIGDLTRPSVARKVSAGKTTRVSMRFRGEDFEEISLLAFALDVSPTRATALLLDAAIRDSEFLNEYVRTFLVDTLDARRMDELKAVMKYLRKNNPFDEDISWAHLLTYIYEEVKDGAQSVADSVGTFITRFK